MAEILGTVASAIGIASFTVQIAESALKLKNLWCSIKDAPEDIRAMINDVESFNDVLSEIQMQTAAHNIPTIDTKITDKCIERCSQALKNLSSALEILELAIKKSPIRGGFKFKLKEDTLTRLRSEVESAKNCMWTARCNYCSALDRYEHSILNSRLTSLHNDLLRLETKISSRPSITNSLELRDSNITARPDLKQSNEHDDEIYSSNIPSSHQVKPLHPTATRLVQTSTPVKGPSWLLYFVGLIQYRKLKFESRRTLVTKSNPLLAEEMVVARWRLPLWLANISWAACLRTTKFGWNLQIKTDHVITSNSPVRAYIESGDIQALQRMFEKREISPDSYMMEKFGYTTSLLSLAIRYAQLEICQLLIALGADESGSRNLSPLSPLQEAVALFSPPRNYTQSQILMIIRLLLEKGNADPDVSIKFPISSRVYQLPTALKSAINSANPEVLYVLQAHLYPPYHERSLAEQFDTVLDSEVDMPKFYNVRHMLGWKTIETETVSSIFGEFILKDRQRSLRLLSYITLEYGASFFYHDSRISSQELKAHLNRLISEMKLQWYDERLTIAFVLFLESFLKAFIESSMSRGDYPKGFKVPYTSGIFEINNLVQDWAAILLSTGMIGSDLQKFGHQEERRYFLDQSRVLFSPFQRWERMGIWEGIGIWEEFESRLISFRSGSEVSDWKACVSDPWADSLVHHFGEFWYMIENPWMNLPGAWLYD